jgi:retron-type reverse transcriptase
MAKRYKHLLEQVATFENLWQASRQARRGKRHRPAVRAFEHALEEHLLDLEAALQADTFRFGAYHTFTITDPKERLICAAPYRDRVVHHALCNVIGPVLDRAMIEDSFACRVGKGTHRALDRAQHFLQRFPWVLRMDIRKFFFCIDHTLLLEMLARKLCDTRLLRLLEQLLGTYTSAPEYYTPFPGDDLFSVTRPRGLPIGNLTSQWFANYYLNPIDRFIKQELGIEGYVRYMDDLLVFGPDVATLHQVKVQVMDRLEALRLVLHPRKSQIMPAVNGIPFLGFILYVQCRRIRRANLQRFKTRLCKQRKRFASGRLSWASLLQSLQAWQGFVGREAHGPLLNQLLVHQPFLRPGTNRPFTFIVP